MRVLVCVKPVCTAQPKKAIIRRNLKKAIDQATNLCRNFEDSAECRIAWDHVSDLSKALHDQYPVKEFDRTELAERIYDT
jgi:hypothetical protein